MTFFRQKIIECLRVMTLICKRIYPPVQEHLLRNVFLEDGQSFGWFGQYLTNQKLTITCKLYTCLVKLP
jgi:hypothetical protein